MAIPKVFISSTCFDLSEIREQLSKFVSSFGFDPILSDHGDVFYHPDLHTHEACVHEVSNCQLFILIIGGRYGGSYTVDKTKSITNAEYEAAINHGIPVFTYIKKDVLSDHHIYSTNSKNEIANKITYPSITKQNDSLSIFNFINQVRRQNKNNSYEGFDNFGQIESHLRKQWAGMFFDFLRTKEIKYQIDATNHLLENLENSNGKLEELIKSLYFNSTKNTEKTQKSIDRIDLSSQLQKFFQIIENELLQKMKIRPKKSFFGLDNLNISLDKHIENISKIEPNNKSWFTYLNEIKLFQIDFHEKTLANNNKKIVVYNHINYTIMIENETILEKIYQDSFMKTTKDERLYFYKNYINSFILKYF